MRRGNILHAALSPGYVEPLSFTTRGIKRVTCVNAAVFMNNPG